HSSFSNVAMETPGMACMWKAITEILERVTESPAPRTARGALKETSSPRERHLPPGRIRSRPATLNGSLTAAVQALALLLIALSVTTRDAAAQGATWQDKSQLLEAVETSASDTILGKWYVVTARPGQPSPSLEIYDPSLDQWSLGPGVPTPRTVAS